MARKVTTRNGKSYHGKLSTRCYQVYQSCRFPNFLLFENAIHTLAIVLVKCNNSTAFLCERNNLNDFFFKLFLYSILNKIVIHVFGSQFPNWILKLWMKHSSNSKHDKSNNNMMLSLDSFSNKCGNLWKLLALIIGYSDILWNSKCEINEEILQIIQSVSYSM